MPIVWTVHIIIITLISWQTFKFYRSSSAGSYFWYGLLSKIAAGLLMGVVYKFYYQGGDTWGFFESAKVLSEMASSDPIGYTKTILGGAIPDHLSTSIGYGDQPRTLVMIRIVSLLALLTGGSYWLSSMYLSIFAFCGLWTLANRVIEAYPDAVSASLMAFIFLPSVWFWSSGITKEAIFMGGFGFLLAWFWPYFKQNASHKYYHWLLAGIIVIVLLQLKYYYMAVLLPVLIATLLYRSLDLSTLGAVRGGASWLLIFGALIFAASWLHPNLRLTYIAEMMQNNALEILSISSATATIHFLDHPNPLVWVMINFPWAALTGLFRPNLGDWGSIFQNIAVIENMAIAIFTIGRLRSFQKNHLLNIQWVTCIVYVLVLAAMITLSTPNFGTLVRYKVAFMPLFVFMILQRNVWWEWLSDKIP